MWPLGYPRGVEPTTAELFGTPEERGGSSPSRRLRFGDFEIDLLRRHVTRDGQRIALRPKSLSLLELLVERAGELVTKNELLDRNWPDVSVSDTVLKVCVRELRAALGDDPRQPRYIETRHRLGYAFIAEVVASDEQGSAQQDVAASASANAFVGRSGDRKSVV